jgi:hypothetical protein
MNSKSGEKLVEHPGSERLARTVLRLVPSGDRDQHDTEPNTARKTAPGGQIQGPGSDGDDDDPGPTAA